MKINSKAALFFILPFLAGAIFLFIYMNPPTSFLGSSESLLGKEDNKTKPQNPEKNRKNTIADVWQWDAFKNVDSKKTNKTSVVKLKPENENTDLVAFDVVFIYDALQRVQLDDNDNVILNHEVLTALDEALDDRVLSLDQMGLDKLQTLIKIGLPGKPGEQSARVVGDYFNYLVAKKEFNQIYPQAKNMQEHRSQYNEMLALRNLYLGEDAALLLFEQEDIDAEHMFATMHQDKSVNSNNTQSKEKKEHETKNEAKKP